MLLTTKLVEERIAIEPTVQADCSSFEQFVRAYETAVFTFCYRMVGDTGMAETIAQKAFLYTSPRFPNLSLADVLVAACKYCRRQLQYERGAGETAVTGIQFLFNNLPIHEREAVALRYGCKLNFDEIAHILGTTCEAVRATLQQGRWHIASLEQTRLASQN